MPKVAKSNHAFSSILSRGNELSPRGRRVEPATPARKRWLDLLKPAIALGKRTRSTQIGQLSGKMQKGSENISVGSNGRPHNCVALQMHDEASDAVVITALRKVPFCCHADLLAMPRPAVFEVARSLNERLPAALRIDDGPERRTGDLREDIEVLVGITKRVPRAPKAIKSLSLTVPVRGPLSTQFERTPRSSPLAQRSMRNARALKLGSLVEEDERMSVDIPHFKRRRFVQDPESPTPKPRNGRHRTQTDAIRPKPKFQPRPRIRSTNMTNAGDVDYAFTTTARPRYRARISEELLHTGAAFQFGVSAPGGASKDVEMTGTPRAGGGAKRKRSIDQDAHMGSDADLADDSAIPTDVSGSTGMNID